MQAELEGLQAEAADLEAAGASRQGRPGPPSHAEHAGGGSAAKEAAGSDSRGATPEDGLAEESEGEAVSETGSASVGDAPCSEPDEPTVA